jgi:IclR family acetate operon transcriptional repressor
MPGRRQHTPRTIVTLPQLAKACAKIKAEGYAADDGEFKEEIRCLAAPIRDRDGIVVASIGISAPQSRFPKERNPIAARQVTELANHISGLLSAGAET